MTAPIDMEGVTVLASGILNMHTQAMHMPNGTIRGKILHDQQLAAALAVSMRECVSLRNNQTWLQGEVAMRFTTRCRSTCPAMPRLCCCVYVRAVSRRIAMLIPVLFKLLLPQLAKSFRHG